MKILFTPKWLSIIVLLICLAGLCIDSTQETTILMINLLLATWLAIALHEIGHVIFGRWSGFTFHSFIVGPFQIDHTTDGIRIRENKYWLFFGGVATLSPPLHMKIDFIMKKWALTVAGGPFLSFVFGIVSYLLYTQLSFMFLLYFAIMNGAIFFATILPFRTSMRTDGYVLLSFLKNNDASIHLLDEMLISKELFSKRPPREWNKENLLLAKQKPPVLDNTQFAIFIYYFEIEQSSFQKAQATLADFCTIPITKKNKFQLGFLIHMQQLAIFFSEDASIDKIKELQQYLSSIEPVSFYRGKAIIAYLEQDKSAATSYIQRVKKIIEQNETSYGFFEAEKTITTLVEEKFMCDYKKTTLRT